MSVLGPNKANLCFYRVIFYQNMSKKQLLPFAETPCSYFLSRLVGIPVGWLPKTLVATIFIIIYQKLSGATKNLGEDTFQNPVNLFGAP